MGGNIPITTKLLIILKNANKITTRPADLKKIPDLELFFILKELKLTKAKTGSVPKAKESIVSPPFKKLPVVKEYNCID